MQSALPRIWTRVAVAVSISYDDNIKLQAPYLV